MDWTCIDIIIMICVFLHPQVPVDTTVCGGETHCVIDTCQVDCALWLGITERVFSSESGVLFLTQTSLQY